MSCAGRNHLAKRSEATRDYTDTNWDGELEETEKLAVVEADMGNGVLKVHNVTSTTNEITNANENSSGNNDNSSSFQVQLPGKFHKLIWFLRNDIIVHDGHTVVRKVSDEQLKRLSKEKPESLFVPAWELQASRHDKRPDDDKEKELLDRRPNWAARAVHTGFTSSDDDDDDDDAEEGEEANQDDEDQ